MTDCTDNCPNIANAGQEDINGYDDASNTNGDACEAYCGDSVAQDPNDDNFSETCDDGNTIDDDGCSNACTLTYCGDGTVQNLNGLGTQ